MNIINKYYYPPVNFWSVWFSETVLKALKKNSGKINTDDSILDVGCGLGNHCFSMLDYKPVSVTGFDISGETINLLKSFTNKIDFKKIDICTDDISSYKCKFSIIFSCDVYEHVNDPQVMLNNLYYLLKDNGNIIITFPNFDDHGHNQLNNVSELSEKLESAGFKKHNIEIVRDRTFIYKLFTGLYIVMQNISDLIYGIKRNPVNRMPESDEFHEMYAYKKINKIKNKKLLIFIINFTYNILKNIGRLTDVYITEKNINEIKNKRIVFWAEK
ncbi:MAG: type 11 methyltransferase [Chlorobi bacterium OLB5]|nr:MAG: type 11 methyltransferase [Chlorobi bacterium OLB5]